MSDKLKVNTLHDEAVQAAELAKPSSAPTYWAKPNCRDCYGRGIAGKVERKLGSNIVVDNLICACATKRFSKWRDDWVKEYLASAKNKTDVSP